MNTHNQQRSVFSFTHLLVILFTGLMAQLSHAANFPEPGDAARGGKAWADNCTRCHNMRSPTDLSDEHWITSAFHMRVRAGLTGQETRDVLSFLQASNGQASSGSSQVASDSLKTEIAITTPRGGQQVYETSCTACHGANGKGSIPGVPDFTDAAGRLTKSDEELLRNVINGIQSPGSPMPMPPRGGNPDLSDAELTAALEYIRKSYNP